MPFPQGAKPAAAISSEPAPNFEHLPGRLNSTHTENVDRRQEQVRHFCRNPRCRSKLPAPVTNLRSAFCALGCHTGFYRTRCRVCERPMVRKTESRMLCGRPKCKSQLRSLQAHLALGCFAAPNGSKTPDFIGLEPAIKPDRGCRRVAGPELDATAFRLANLPPDPVTAARVDRTNRGYWREANETTLIKRHHPPVNVLGGDKFPDAPEIDLSSPIGFHLSLPPVLPADGDPWAIPDFLVRTDAALMPEAAS